MVIFIVLRFSSVTIVYIKVDIRYSKAMYNLFYRRLAVRTS